ncbi:iron complex outermembrane receptor protein [Granulicella aggregans]|uniref:Iron complex outermembrane receptor protein n=1 Tax=Granulicella aggregans TaxID=474949 RepID=A0A7W7ZGG6_9BACT|nr:TonB-dependent receptor [Granulicella aggregans]MBB5059423.1 iron complex outermembrane receptor protein [Granulicella aggregans]
MNDLILRLRTALALALFITFGLTSLSAQAGPTGSLQGAVVDQSGRAVKGAAIALISPSNDPRTAVTNGEGRFVVTGLPLGTYTVEVSAAGFAQEERQNVVVTSGNTADLPIALRLASASEEVTVESDADTSIASQLSPVKALLDMASPRSEITSMYIRQYTSPVTDFADILQAAPGTVSYSTNGIGNGQSKTWFRGFADGAFTMTWDGVPFQDSNDPTHHSWAYVPAPAISYVDFDRSPGTASDVGPTNFAGSVHMFSPKMGKQMTFKMSESYGSFNTNQILGEFNSGLFGGKNPKANIWFEGHHNTSDGYQTFNDQQRTAGTVKFNYQFSEKMYLTTVGTVVLVDSNTPDSDPTRQQIADHGLNYVMDGNKFIVGGKYDGLLNSLYYKNFTYHVPTNFEIITFGKEFGKGWKLEAKPYTYSYSNHQHLQKKQDQDLLAATPIYEPVNATSAVNKLNQYNRGGEITTLSDATRYGVFRVGGWYEYTTTHRFQVKSNPSTWLDSPLLSSLKFHEYFKTNSVQPYIEYQLVAIPKLTITAGLKSALYTMDLSQLADGSTVGSLGCKATTIVGCAGISTKHNAYYNNLLPSVAANYRIASNWSAYAQFGRGSEIPPSSVFDVTGAQVAVTPKPTVATTYQGGTVVKLNHISFDADVFHIHYENAYSSYAVTDTTRPDFGDSYFYSTPPSNTTGFEAEGNVFVAHGLSFNFSGTAGEAKYEAAAAQTLGNGTVLAATPVQWVASSPNYTVSAGFTYQDKNWDFGFFNKDIGPRWVDNGAIHQTTQLNSFWMNNLFLNYSFRHTSMFDGSKIKLSFNNLFDFHDLVGLSPGVSATAAVPYAVSGSDQLQLLPGRSVMATFQFGFKPRER